MSVKSILAHLGRPNSNYGEAVFRNSRTDDSSIYETVNSNDSRPNYNVLTDEEDFLATWVVPDGVYSICAVAIGSGGSGEGSNTLDAGSGGGGGGLVYINHYPVYPNQELKIYVGTPGKNTTDGASGKVGFPSAIYANDLPLIVAGGGGGGRILTEGGTGAGGFGVTGAVIFSGGNGYVGSGGTGGDGGNAAGYKADGSDGSSLGGDGGAGTSPYGPLGLAGSQFPAGLATTPSNGGVGADYGAGGGGANDELADGTDYDGGDGGEGIVRIIWGPDRNFPDHASELESYGNVTQYDVSTTS